MQCQILLKEYRFLRGNDMDHNLYRLTGKTDIREVLPFSIQQVLAMFVTNMVPIFLICSAAKPEMEVEEILSLVQSAMLAAGIASFIQATPIWKLGSGLPIIMGASFTFVVPLAAIAAKHGYGAVTGCVLAGGILEGLLGISVRYWRKMLVPIVSALVVTGIGLSLLTTAADSFGGGNAEDFGSFENLGIGTVTLITCIAWNVFVKGSRKHLSILVGGTVGYLFAILLGKVDFSEITQGNLFALPRVLPYTPVFRLDAIISVSIIYLVSATETLGDAAAVASGALNRELTMEEAGGALTIDGFGSVISGLLGGTPVTSYSENVGLTIMTRVVNRNVCRAAGVMLMLAGFFPPIGRFFNTIPSSVIGGVLLVVLGQVLVSGMEMIAAAGFTPRNKLITAISLSVAIGCTATTEIGLWENFPVAIQSVFSQNVVAVIFVIAIVLNLVLPRKMDDEMPKADNGPVEP